MSEWHITPGLGTEIKRAPTGDIVAIRTKLDNDSLANVAEEAAIMCRPHQIHIEWDPARDEDEYAYARVYRVFKWTVEIEVSPVWVADGFDLDDDRAERMLERMLPWARSTEMSARVLTAPDPRSIRKEQGYVDPG